MGAGRVAAVYVLTDFKWVPDSGMPICPTQLAAIRVNEDWDTVNTFSALVRSKDCPTQQEDDVSHSRWCGPNVSLSGEVKQVLYEFQTWLVPDDILCWWYRAPKRFYFQLAHADHAVPNSNTSIFLNEYLFSWLLQQPRSVGTPHTLCKAHDIQVPQTSDAVLKDVLAMQALLKGIGFPQSRLCTPTEQWAKDTPARKGSSTFPLLYDPETRLLHRSDCACLPERRYLPGYSSFQVPIRRGYPACICCRKEYFEALRERNAEWIARTGYPFLYSGDSHVFHAKDCPHALLIHKLRGTFHYDTCARSRRPCKLCHPHPDVRNSETPESSIPALPPRAKDALKRFYQAKQEQEAIGEQEGLTKAQRSKALQLTHPGLAFWAGVGYRTFHLKTCPKLAGLSQIRGFPRYQDAVQAGYSPCRLCKPTSKQDIRCSIPITSQVRPGESCETLVKLCAEHHLPFQHDDKYFILRTAAGKWRIHMCLRPVQLEHINLITNPNCQTYHIQPRLFLSLQDTFSYIIRHDKALLKKTKHSQIAPGQDQII